MNAFKEVMFALGIFTFWLIVVPVFIYSILIIKDNKRRKARRKKKMWEKYLDNIRSGKGPIQTAESGIPQIGVNAQLYELMQLMVALTAGYNKNCQRLEMLRKTVKIEMEGK